MSLLVSCNSVIGDVAAGSNTDDSVIGGNDTPLLMPAVDRHQQQHVITDENFPVVAMQSSSPPPPPPPPSSSSPPTQSTSAYPTSRPAASNDQQHYPQQQQQRLFNKPSSSMLNTYHQSGTGQYNNGPSAAGANYQSQQQQHNHQQTQHPYQQHHYQQLNQHQQQQQQPYQQQPHHYYEGPPTAYASLPYKSGPSQFNFSRQQRYTPYFSRSLSNGSNTSGGTNGTNGIAGNCFGGAQQRYAHPNAFGGGNTGGQPTAAASIFSSCGSMSSVSSVSSGSCGSSSSASSVHNVSLPPTATGGGLLNSTQDSGFLSNSYEPDGSGSGSGSGNSNSNNNMNMSLNASMGAQQQQQLAHWQHPSQAALELQQQQQQQPTVDSSVTLQISNIDTSIEDRALKHYLLGKLKPLTPIISFAYEGLSMVRIRVPSQHHAKQVVSYLHRKKIGHKRITVSYTRDSSTMEPSTLRCQVAGLLKDIPFYKLSMYKFRELFQSRFKTSISVMDLYDMKDICTIGEHPNEEKYISLRPELINSIENSELLGCLQLSVPYCSAHFKSGQRGWAELEIEPLPNVYMSVAAVRAIVYDLLKRHKGDIPIASLVYCVDAELGVQMERNEAGVNLEHLISCVGGVHITTNKFGIKILSWLAASSVINAAAVNGNVRAICGSGSGDMVTFADDGMQQQHQQLPPQYQQQMLMGNRYTKFANVADPFGQISREIVELVRMSPKSTMKFSRFIPAYHNHFGKQCRVADYGYTKLIELFEALHGVVQIMGDGENRQITLTHKCQIRCFTTDVMRLLRSQANKSMSMVQLETLFGSGEAGGVQQQQQQHLQQHPHQQQQHQHQQQQQQQRQYDITDYGVCTIEDIMESLIRNNVLCVERQPSTMPTPNSSVSSDSFVGGNGSSSIDDTVMIVSIPKRRQTRQEMQKTCTFAGEVVDLLRNSSQYAIPFEKFACSYHYNYGYQCRLSDYGYLKLTDLMEAITGVVEIELCNGDEDRKVSLSPKVAQRVFGEQLRDLTKMLTGCSVTPMNLSTLLFYHKKQFGYQMQPQSLGIGSMWHAIRELPFVELTTTNASSTAAAAAAAATAPNDDYVLVCHHDDAKFVHNGYAACRVVLESGKWAMPLANFIDAFFGQFSLILNEHMIDALNHAVEIVYEYGAKCVRISPLMAFVLRIIGVLEMMNVVSVNDLKSILNIGISDCFAYGYPNFSSLLHAFPDIFHCSSPMASGINDLSEISLNKHCLLARKGVQEFVRSGNAKFAPAMHPNDMTNADIDADQLRHQRPSLHQTQPRQYPYVQKQPNYINDMMPFRDQPTPSGRRLFQSAVTAGNSMPPPQPLAADIGRFDGTWNAAWHSDERALSSKYAVKTFQAHSSLATLPAPPPGISTIGRRPTTAGTVAVPSVRQHSMLNASDNVNVSAMSTASSSSCSSSGESSTHSSPIDPSSLSHISPPPLPSMSADASLTAPPNASASDAEKENFYTNVMLSPDFDISAIEKMVLDSLRGLGTSQDESPPSPPAERVPLYERRPSDEWLSLQERRRQSLDSVGVVVKSEGIVSDDDDGDHPSSPGGSSTANCSMMFDPPKPDTPPSNVPFWMDPIWRHDSPGNIDAVVEPRLESLSIALPELKTVDELPALDTPTVMQGLLEHNPEICSRSSTFNFDVTAFKHIHTQ